MEHAFTYIYTGIYTNDAHTRADTRTRAQHAHTTRAHNTRIQLTHHAFYLHTYLIYMYESVPTQHSRVIGSSYVKIIKRRRYVRRAVDFIYETI